MIFSEPLIQINYVNAKYKIHEKMIINKLVNTYDKIKRIFIFGLILQMILTATVVYLLHEVT